MQKIFFKILFSAFIFTVFFVPIFEYYLEIKSYFPEKTIPEYYSMLRNQETILPGETISADQKTKLKNCGEDINCFLEFYENYNASSTLEQTFSNLSLLLRENPEYVDYCHQMTHGIGHAELRKNNDDLGKTLLDFTNSNFFKNISTCGSGYYHGVLEESVREEKDKEKLI